MESIHLQVPAELLERIDKERHMVPRNAWIRFVIEEALHNIDKAKGQPVNPPRFPTREPE